MLAAVAVAGGSAVVGMPEAHAGYSDRGFFFRKLDESGELLGGSRWKIEYQNYTEYADGSGLGSLDHYIIFVEDGLTQEKFAQLGLYDPQKELEYLRDKFGFEGDQLQSREKFSEGEYPVVDLFGGVTVTEKMQRVLLLSDLSPVEGEIATTGAFYAAIGNRRLSDPNAFSMHWSTATKFTEISTPVGYESCDDANETSAEFSFPQIVYDRETGEYETVADAQLRNVSGRALINLERDRPDQILQDFGGPNTVLEYIYPIADFTNCKIPETTPTPSTVTETVTETPEPSTTTVTPPTTTVTLPSTVTTTVTPPATTVTETPEAETTTATTTESATTTVTETPKTETVTETPQRETVTETPTPKTETVTETPQKETVTETPKTETVTHTPDKETVTETPKASTETKTSTVTAPQVTVTETPKQVTETVTLPQKTVTEQVPTTVVENKTETVKVPPVTVTTTEKQEPTTVTATPDKVTETVKVPGEKTTVVETQPGEPVTVTETPRENIIGVVTASDTQTEEEVVNEETPEVPVSEESTTQSSNTTTSRILASTGANVVGLVGIAGFLIGAAVFVTRRKK